jgi:ribosomal protein L37AE/L43A
MSTLYYYVDSSNQTQGPLTLEELIDLRRKGVIRNATQVVELGEQNWRQFSSLLPPPDLPPPPLPPMNATADIGPATTLDRACPKCAAPVSVAAKVCQSCRFAIADFEENRRSTKFTKMDQIPYSEADLSAALLQVYKGKNGGCFALALLIGGTLALLIPIIGWMIAPICWVLGFFILLAPVRGLRYTEKIMNNEEYQKNVHAAKILLHNRFKNVSCPNCGHKEAEITWRQEGGFWDCPGCQKRLLRERDYLFLLPKPEAIPNNNMIESFAER